MKKFDIPDHVKYIINTIEKNGYEAWCVGGCVRDLIMNTPVNDYDIASSAPAELIHGMFERTVDTGIKHGTVTVVINGVNYEITQYRIDGEYKDGRHPEKVEFTSNFELDLSRRDFTVNAIGYHHDRGLFDPYNGQQDINRKLIVAVGEPQKRFSEDALRIMRAFRFSSTLGFDIENETLDCAVKGRKLLQKVSAERICAELFKLLSGDNPAVLGRLLDKDLSELNLINNDSRIRFAALCYILDKDALSAAEQLKTDRRTRKLVDDIYAVFLNQYPQTKPQIKRLLANIPQNLWLSVMQAMSVLKKTTFDSGNIQSIIDNGEPYLVSHLDLTAEDKSLINKNFKGEKVKQILQMLVDTVIENPKKNKQEILKRLITQNCQNS